MWLSKRESVNESEPLSGGTRAKRVFLFAMQSSERSLTHRKQATSNLRRALRARYLLLPAFMLLLLA